jgi:S1-C subfamily serine protease
VRYSPYVGLVFENPHAAESPEAEPWWKTQGRGGRRAGAVVKAVVDGGPVALRMKDSPLDTAGGGCVGGRGEEGQGFVAPGDVLIDVDGHDVDETVSMSRVLELLAGAPGSPVTLVFRR